MIIDPMKNKSFANRLSYAWQGVRTAWAGEKRFRTQVMVGGGAIGLLIVLRPNAIWWAIFLLITGAVLAAELINTALEHVVDKLHPEVHPAIRSAKDCAAGAVLVLSIAALGILAAFLIGQ